MGLEGVHYYPAAKLGDFGHAQNIRQDREVSELRDDPRGPLGRGTPLYMAPVCQSCLGLDKDANRDAGAKALGTRGSGATSETGADDWQPYQCMGNCK